MTVNRNLKRRVRARAAKTGESYVTALRHVLPDVNLVRLATAQVVVRDNPRDSSQLRQSGRDVRELMRQAVDGAGLGAPFDAAAPAAQQHVRDLGPG
jgi:hypothetical protein